jgi:hypothetical protein
MTKTKKRPTKAAKAAKRIVKDSKLLAEKTERDQQSGSEFKESVVSPRANKAAMKPRPNKKRG